MLHVYVRARGKNAHTLARTYVHVNSTHPRDPVPPIEVRDDGARLSADQS
jgi:hypothetical protein